MGARAERQSYSDSTAHHQRGWARNLAVAGFLLGTVLGALLGLFVPGRPRPQAAPRGTYRGVGAHRKAA
jgi:hypothetical protein